MTERYLLDTSVMMLLVRGEEPARVIDQRFGLSSAAERPLVSIVTHAELHLLALSNGWGVKKMSALAATLANVVTVEILSGSILEAYVALSLASRRHRPSARAMSDNDLWIAATAKVAHATLLTTDKDFTHLSPNHCRVVLIDPHTGTPQEISNGQEEEGNRVGRRHRGDAGLRHGRR
ncbi:MAG: PIN domain-containing protein [Myxococcus sp.]|nr:PIN domain-containing protein [Myxococcus sp.]